MSEYLQKSKQYKDFHYSIIDPEKLDYLHKRTMEIFLEIKKILNANNLKYMICGGTLLGAATTGKFIPWDDDFDMCVFEEDYEKALDLLIKYMPKDVIVQCPQTEPHYFHGWVKIRDTRSCVYPSTESYANNGVWVDMYKLTKSRRKDIEKLIAQEHLAYLERRYKVGDISQEEKDKRIRDNKVLERIDYAIESSLRNQDDSNVYIIWSASKIVLEDNWVLPLKQLDFEGITVTTFGEYREYLTAHYGSNYNRLPPYELMRIGINQIEIY